MRTIPESIAAGLAEGVTTLAHVWRITRRDGDVFVFTDHDRPLSFDALTAEPQLALRVGAIEKSLGLNVDSASLAGALISDSITESDLARGLWDGARVDLFKVNWTDPSARVHVFSGRIGEVRRGVRAFEAELRGVQAPFNVPVGRVYSRHCDADLGDARCGKDIETSTFRKNGTVTEVLNSTAFVASGLGAYEEGWFTRGRLVWDEGGEREVSAHRMETAGAVIELLDAPGDVLQIGAAFTIYAGCDKRHETCRLKFENVVNFRGFPHMPGNDAVQSGPPQGVTLDGSSRWR
jgi:uncharacterized phage protein (TIGR02218 family)